MEKARTMYRSLGLLVFLLIIEYGTNADACSETATNLQGLGNRSVLVDSLALGVVAVDDENLNDGWYRPISDGVQYIMADSTNIPEADACGAYYPIYLQDEHPDTSTISNGTELTRTACLRSYVDQCDITYSVRIRKCNEEIHYHLKTTARYASYCFDPDFLNADFNPVVRPGLYRESRPAGRREEYIPHLTFECDFTFTLQYNLIVKWMVDDMVVATLGPTINRTELVLYEQTLIGANITTIGFNIKCEVSVSQGSTLSLVIGTSDVFFAGIVMLTKSVTATKSSTFKVYFKLTVPLGCRDFNTNNPADICDAELRMIDVDQNSDTCMDETAVQSLGHRCGTFIPAVRSFSEWDPDRLYEVTMVTTDRHYDDHDTFTLSFIVDDNFGSEIWKGYQPENVNVQVQFGACSSWSTVGRCICAVVMRAGSDIFEFNFCGNNTFIGFKNCEQGGILRVVKRRDQWYQVHSPIGTYFDVRIWLPRSLTYYPSLNVWLYLAPKDINNTAGLCGTFDYNINNDFQLRNNNVTSSYIEFAENWRVATNESLFDSDNYNNHGRWEDTNQYFCYCNKIGDNTYESVCSAILDKDCGLTVNNDETTRFCSQYAKRSVHSGYHEELKRRLNRPSRHSSRIHKRNSDVTISESEANETCTTSIMGSAAAQFGEILTAEDITAAIENCIFDVVAMNDTTFAEDYATSLNEMIKTELDRDPEFKANNSDLVHTFYVNSCERNCSGLGTCTSEGVCDCDMFYHGDACTIDERDALIIDDVTGGGFCDITLGDCVCYDVITENLLDGFQCRTEQIIIYSNGTEHSIDTPTYNGSRLTIFDGECCIPDVVDRSTVSGMLAIKYLVSISNDGITYSNNRTIHVYDGTCQQPSSSDSETAVVLVNGTGCYIGSSCYTENETDISDACLVCHPQIDQFSWSQGCNVSPSNTASATRTASATTTTKSATTTTTSSSTTTASATTVSLTRTASAATTQTASATTQTATATTQTATATTPRVTTHTTTASSPTSMATPRVTTHTTTTSETRPSTTEDVSVPAVGTESDSSSIMPIVAGIGGGVVLLVVITAVVIYKYKHRPQRAAAPDLSTYVDNLKPVYKGQAFEGAYDHPYPTINGDKENHVWPRSNSSISIHFGSKTEGR